MPAPKPPAFETLSLHAGQHPDAITGARAVPIYQTTSYVFQDSDHAAALFNLERAGHIYTRISNPTTAVLEERLAALENGVGAVCTASGMAALHLAIATLLNAGDHIVASSSLYGGTINLLAHTLPRFGITTSFVKPRDLDAFKAAIKPNTRLVIGETIGNPGLEVLDIPAVADIAHAAKIPLLIDNTFATPFLSRPIELGADIVMNSATKWIGGHGIAIGGVDRRWRPLRLARLRQIPATDRTLCRLSRHRFRRAVRHCRLHHARPHRRIARFRRVSLADQCVPAAARRRDAGHSHGAPYGQHAWRCWRRSRPTRRSTGCCIRRWRTIRITNSRNACCRAAPAPSSRLASRAAAMPAANSSRR